MKNIPSDQNQKSIILNEAILVKNIHFFKHGFFLCIFCLGISQLFAQPEKLVFSPHWIPQAQFAGYYVALDQGFYTEAGLDVQILHPSASVSAFDYLTAGKADLISSFLMDGIKQRAQGVPLVNIGQLSQHSALMMVAKKSSGISELKDLNSKRLGIWSTGFDDIPIALMRENNYHIELVRVLNTINLFMMDGVDALTVMYYNEYDQIINSGVNEDELTRFFFSEYGLDIPEDGWYCLEKTYSEKKEALKKFIGATLRGWEYAAKNKEYTIDVVVGEMNKAHLPNNKAHQQWMLDKILEMIAPGNKNVKRGHLMEQDYSRAVNIIKAGLDGKYNETALQRENFYKPLAD
ncbi:MAG: ABC transporter substrate-binding protein [Prolixibacteraceae bacterium]|jgi:NitT/TauT family transport system substrate-binding protein|nr:ABC transporter substrate-binding protein [Prolixibacteraceae bacterium]